MRLTVRSKLIAIVSTAVLAFLVLLLASALIERRIERELTEVRERYVPRMELGPKLRHALERLTRGVQDATAAQDLDALSATRATMDQIVAELDDGAQSLAPGRAGHKVHEVREVRDAIEDYYGAATDVARRLMAEEGGEALVDAMAAMQAKQLRATQLLTVATSLEEGEVSRAFEAVDRAQRVAVQVRFAITVTCLLIVMSLAFWLGRSVLRSIADLDRGLQRFGRGEFDHPIQVAGRDELGALATQANEMAARLKMLNEERDRSDWMKEGQVGLSNELRGELDPGEVAERCSRFLAQYLSAPVVAFYGVEKGGTLRLFGHFGFERDEANSRRIVLGEGLLGQAACEPDVSVIGGLPDDYLRVRSGLGEAKVQEIAFVPLMRSGRMLGVVELAKLEPVGPAAIELLRAVQAMIAVALEAARARATMRDLLDESQRLTQRLLAQEEELRATNDELRAQQEELQAQQEELREANEVLTAQSTELMAQQRALEAKNDELAEARLRLEQKADELASVSAYKSQFLANMSHELRTPLNSMLLLSNLLAENEGGGLSARQVEFCKTIHAAGNDLLALINQVLDLAKIEAGKQEASFEPVVLREIAERVERVFAPLARDKGLELQAAIDEDAPERIVTDKHRLDQILNNLIGNAIKFTERGAISLRIGRPQANARLGAGLELERTVAFEVADTGIGIAPDKQEAIFAPFEQVDGSADRRYGGTGLGLTIGRELAGLLGGELQLWSAPGEGSRFTCYLPCDPTAAARQQPIRPVGAARDEPRTTALVADDRATIAAGDPYLLVVEDDPVFAELTGEVIHEQGLKHIVVSDGARAREVARARKPSGVILDVRLPGESGFDVMKALRSDPETADVPVHFVSAMDAADRGMALGAVGYLTKPASRSDLVRAVRALAPKAQHRPCCVLIIEDDAQDSESLAARLSGEALEVLRACSASEALEALERHEVACIVLDLSLPDMDGLDLLRKLHARERLRPPPVVVYTARPLSKPEARQLEAYSEAIVLKDGSSAERVLDEVRLFARRLKAGLPATRSAPSQPPMPLRLEGKTLLVVDDDMRTVYALSAILRAKGADVLMADTGKAALELLEEHGEVDVVLMDIMMPEMDGYEAIRRIRQDGRRRALPIIALTAKAMKGDREKCLEVGATDYLPKPIDPEALTTVLHARLKEASTYGA